ncbi:MAG: glutaredoxin family protein [Bacteroidetes bacterium]|nr:glutaredoxin family protein [Bacteroidota bacterium]
MQKIIMYSTSWCSDCVNAKRFLKEKNIQYEEIDIDKNESAAEQVINWSGGRRVIPTFHIIEGDNSNSVVMHNPPLNELAEVLKVSY